MLSFLIKSNDFIYLISNKDSSIMIKVCYNQISFKMSSVVRLIFFSVTINKSVISLLTHCRSQKTVNLSRYQSKNIFSTVPSLENLDILHKERYLGYKPKLDPSLTKLMKGLSDCAVRKLDSNIDLITLSECALPNDSIETSGQFIYARSFYPELLKQIRKYDRVVLLSNPDTGKSMC